MDLYRRCSVLPSEWPYLQVYSQKRTEHIVMVLSDAVCELFAVRNDIPAQFAVLMFFLCVLEALVIKELWHASCGGFWTSLIC